MEEFHSLITLPHFLPFFSPFLHNKVFHNLADCGGAAVARSPPSLSSSTSLPHHFPDTFPPPSPSLPRLRTLPSHVGQSVHVPPLVPPPGGSGRRGGAGPYGGRKQRSWEGSHVAFVQKASVGALLLYTPTSPPVLRGLPYSN